MYGDVGMTTNTVQLYWYWGNDEGLTDDLGIIADRDQWVPARPAGWYIHTFGRSLNHKIKEWCRENLESYEEFGRIHVDHVILDHEDAVLFRMRWL